MVLRRVLSVLYNWFRPIRIYGSNNTIKRKSGLGEKFHILVNGNDNRIDIGHNCVLTNTIINISGNNNRLIIEDDVRFLGPCEIRIMGGGTLHIKRNAGVRGVEFNINEAKVFIGERCMFSYGITIRNHDSHRIINAEGEVVNKPKDIVLGNHVWIAQNVTILKGCYIGDDSVIGFGAIVTKGCANGTIMTSVPAKPVKGGITWDY